MNKNYIVLDYDNIDIFKLNDLVNKFKKISLEKIKNIYLTEFSKRIMNKEDYFDIFRDFNSVNKIKKNNIFFIPFIDGLTKKENYKIYCDFSDDFLYEDFLKFLEQEKIMFSNNLIDFEFDDKKYPFFSIKYTTWFFEKKEIDERISEINNEVKKIGM